MARSHGIKGAEYSTDGGSTWTPIDLIVEEDSSLEPQGPEEPVEDPYGNAYWAPKFWNLNLVSLDESAYAALNTEWGGDNKVRLRFDLDGETFEMTSDHLVPVSQRTIEGRVEGRSEGFQLGGPDQDVRVPDADVTIS